MPRCLCEVLADGLRSTAVRWRFGEQKDGADIWTAIRIQGNSGIVSKLGNVSLDERQIFGRFGIGHVELLVESRSSWRAVLDDCAFTQATMMKD